MRYCILFLLTACTTRVQMPEPVEVKVPLMVSCASQRVPEPDWNIPHLAVNADTSTKLKAILADFYLSKSYIEELNAELKACS